MKNHNTVYQLFFPLCINSFFHRSPNQFTHSTKHILFVGTKNKELGNLCKGMQRKEEETIPLKQEFYRDHF